MGKKEKYGRLHNGEIQTIPGKVEVFVYHSKNQLAGPFKGKQAAVDKANELVEKNIRYDKHAKN